MSLAARLKMFEQAACDNAVGMRPGSAVTKGRPTWGAARGPSLADQIKQVRAPVWRRALCIAALSVCPSAGRRALPGEWEAAETPRRACRI